MQIEHQASLRPFNTFGLDAIADQLITLDSISDIFSAFNRFQEAIILGGGSNIMLGQPKYKSVILNRIKGIETIRTEDNRVLIGINGGEDWHDVVRWALNHNLGGIENLSLIPGTAGAAPIQNIGAYGVELMEVFHGLEYFRFDDQTLHYIDKEGCHFGYRNSIFKNELRNKGFISRIYLWLTSTNHRMITDYSALENHLKERGHSSPSIRQISDAVIAIRQSKLPDWRQWGNAGSFFKNPIIPTDHFRSLQSEFPKIPSYPAGKDTIKIPAAWLIQEAGFKGKNMGQAGSYKDQPLVLFNRGSATAADILRLKNAIQEKVHDLFTIYLTPEVTIL